MKNRKYTRITLNFNADLKINHQWLRQNKILDLSLGGCLLQVEEEFDSNAPCQVEIALGDGDNPLKIKVKGRVVRSMPGNLSLKFTEIGLESFHHLQNLIRYNAPDPDRISKELEEHQGLI